MNLKLLKRIYLLFFILVIFGICKVNAAGSFSISASKTTVNPNEIVTLSITGNNAYGVVEIRATGNVKLSANSVFLQNDTKTIDLEAKSPGNINIVAVPAIEGL